MAQVVDVEPAGLPVVEWGSARSLSPRPKAVMVPYAWNRLPKKWVDPAIEKVQSTLDALGIDVVTTDPVETVVSGGGGYGPVEQIRIEDPDFIILFLASTGSANDVVNTVQDFWDRKPLLIWGYPNYLPNGQASGGWMDSFVVKGSVEDVGAKPWFLYREIDDPEVQRTVRGYAQVALTKRRLQRTKLGMFGYTAWGMYSAMMDPVSLRRKIGPEGMIHDQLLLYLRMQEIDDAVVEEHVAGFRAQWKISDVVTPEHLLTAARMYLALKELAVEHRFDAVTLKCHFELSQVLKFSPCVPLSLLGDEIDCSCESDVPLLVTQVMLRYLSGGLPTTYGDIQSLTGRKQIGFGPCGFSPFGVCEPEVSVSHWKDPNWGGMQNSTSWKKGTVTLARLRLMRREEGNRFIVHLARGEVTHGPLPGEAFSDPYTGGYVTIEGDVDHFLANAYSNHYAFVWADVKDELVELCRQLDVETLITE